jgi:hypothetical protein
MGRRKIHLKLALPEHRVVTGPLIEDVARQIAAEGATAILPADCEVVRSLANLYAFHNDYAVADALFRVAEHLDAIRRYR